MRRTRAQIRLWTLVGTAIFAFTLFGCADQMLPPNNSSGSRKSPTVNNGTLTGNVRFEEELPDNARLLVLWDVTATDPDVTYVFGEGTIDPATKTFRITLPEIPDAGAMNWYDNTAWTPTSGEPLLIELGVAYVIVTTDQQLEQGKYYETYALENKFRGTIDNTCLIYRYYRDLPASLCSSEWYSRFDVGYSFGTGVPNTTCAFDGFTPLTSGQPTLIINSDADRFTFVDWS